jgi:hypothetical protein
MKRSEYVNWLSQQIHITEEQKLKREQTGHSSYDVGKLQDKFQERLDVQMNLLEGELNQPAQTISEREASELVGRSA